MPIEPAIIPNFFKVDITQMQWEFINTLKTNNKMPIKTPVFVTTTDWLDEPLKNTPALKPDKSNKDYSKVVVSDIHKYEPLNKYVGIEGQSDIRAGTTFVGLEIELEKVCLKTDIAGTWKIDEDNSLKDNGREFITIPIQFKYLEVELERLFSGIKSAHASDRCSVHVHINARDFTLEQLKSFIALYLIFEKSMYNFSGNRWNNNFCVPLNFYPDMVSSFVNSLDKMCIKEAWYKYYGLNLSPIFGGESSKIGTIEFRHMKGTMDKQYILNWINLIVSLKITAKKMKYSEIENHVITMNTTSGYYWLADKVFKDYKGLIIDQPTFKQDVEYCISKTKQILFPATKNKETKDIVLINKKGL